MYLPWIRCSSLRHVILSGRGAVGRSCNAPCTEQETWICDLPVVIPPGVDPNKALDDNQTYKAVWQVLNALRSHDDRFDAMINKMD